MAERRFRYDGPHDEVYIPALGQAVKRNHQVKAEGSIAESLSQQSDWQEIGKQVREETESQPSTESEKAIANGG